VSVRKCLDSGFQWAAEGLVGMKSVVPEGRQS
jgi:hypothetical protein